MLFYASIFDVVSFEFLFASREALLMPSRQIARSSVRLLKGKIVYNPDPKGEFLCGLDDKCRKVHIIRLARIHRVHRNLRLYYCDRIDCSKALLKVDTTDAKEEYGVYTNGHSIHGKNDDQARTQFP